MYQTLKKYFGYDSFRPQQEAIIRSVLAKNDTLVLMPTGGGKSLCYQIPALMMPGTAIVVSPLISLMKDQVEALQESGIYAAALNSNNTDQEAVSIRRDCISGKVKILYISPERLLSEIPFLLKSMQLSLFAIDEAHCISQWGHDFRPEYTQLNVLHQYFPEIPVIALTATADKVTREDIVQQLGLVRPQIFISSFDRPNLNLVVRKGLKKKEKTLAILDFLSRHENDSGIIYCMSRKTTEDVAAMLQEHGISAAVYHAGLSPEERNFTQEEFLKDRIQVVCATVAFGMGINKSNVRYVIHYNLPKSIECFYQEIGRAGRDGMPADTLLFYSYGDIAQLTRFAEESGQQGMNKERLQRMQEYAEASVCRRRILLNYFGEQSAHDCGNCDVCRNPPLRFDGTVLVQKALSAIMRTGQHAGFHLVVDILRGNQTQEIVQRGYDQLKTYGAGHDVPARHWHDYLLQMLQLGLLEIDYKENLHLKVTPSGAQVLYGKSTATLAQIREEKPQVTPRKRKTVAVPRIAGQPLLSRQPLFEEESADGLFEALRALRKRLADEQGFPPYIIMSDNTLHLLCSIKPTTVDAFGMVSGISDFKKQKYGEEFVALIRNFL